MNIKMIIFILILIILTSIYLNNVNLSKRIGIFIKEVRKYSEEK